MILTENKQVCAYCQIIRLQAKDRPDVLVLGLQECGQLPEQDSAEGAVELQDEIDWLRTELSVAKSALLGNSGNETVPSLKAELLAAKRNLEAANIRVRQLENMAGKSLDIIRLQELAWKFAEGVISGEVIGVEVEDIRLLRGVQ